MLLAVEGQCGKSHCPSCIWYMRNWILFEISLVNELVLLYVNLHAPNRSISLEVEVGQWVSMMAIDHMHTMPGTCHSHSVQLSWSACQYHFWNAWWISGCQVPCLGTWHLAYVPGT